MENEIKELVGDLDIPSAGFTSISVDYGDENEAKDGKHACNDPVNHPYHYTFGNIECMDLMKDMLTKEEFHGYLKATALKYLWRFERKGNPVQDLNKCKFYIDKLIEELEMDDE